MVEETDEIRISMIDEHLSVNSELQAIIDEQDRINETLSQPFPTRIVSVNESQLEYELAKLVFGQPEHEYDESTFLPADNPP